MTTATVLAYAGGLLAAGFAGYFLGTQIRILRLTAESLS